MQYLHQDLASGRWFQLSLCEQLGNIGSEIQRVIRARNDDTRYEFAVSRALELFDLTLSDPRWKKRLKELCRTRELFCEAAYFGGELYNTSLEDLDKYFFQFAMAARLNH